MESYESVFKLSPKEIIKAQLELAKKSREKTVSEILSELLEQLRNAKSEKELRVIALKLFELGIKRGARMSELANTYWAVLELVSEIAEDIDSASDKLASVLSSYSVEVV